MDINRKSTSSHLWLYYNLRRMFAQTGGWFVHDVHVITSTLGVSQSTFYRLRAELRKEGMVAKVGKKWKFTSLSRIKQGRILAKMPDSAYDKKNFKAFAQESYAAMRVRRLNSRFTFRASDGSLVKNRGQRCGLPQSVGRFALSLLESDFDISKRTAWTRRQQALELGYVKFHHKHEVCIGDIYDYTDWRLQNQEWANMVRKSDGLYYLTLSISYNWSPIAIVRASRARG